MDDVSKNTHEINMNRLFRIHNCFKGIRWRYLWILIVSYMFCSIGFDLFTGHQVSSSIRVVLNDWPKYLFIIIVYIIVSKVRKQEKKKK